MLTKYIFLNSGVIIIHAIVTFIIIFLGIFITSKLFNFSVDYVSFSVGAIIVYIVMVVIDYRKWLRLQDE